MKKVLLTLTLGLFTIAGFAAVMEGVDKQYVITDCGTVHEIPADSDVEEACDALERYTEEDC